ncbi:MAG: hypothetical protein Q9225_006977, partial [Loekoesia sp. 1 TL-2023]
MSSSKKRPSQQRRNLTSDTSTFAKLKHYFNKGSRIQKEETTVPKTQQTSQTQMDPNQYMTRQDSYDGNGPARPDLVPPRGPHQLPRAVQAEARDDQDEVENESIFSSPSNAPSTSLTSIQSSRHSERVRSKPSKKRTSAGLPISSPKPTKSLLDLTSQYADVQGPEKAQDAIRRPAPPADSKPSSYKAANRRVPKRKNSQPVKEVAKGRAQVVQGPSHQRSQKTVVRKMEPQPARKADDSRHMSHVTVFEDFMGHSPPPVPPLPADASKLAPGPSQAHRLSRPFREASEFEKPINDSSEDISPTTVPISPTESHAQTWL